MSKRLEVLQTMIDKGSEDPFVWYARAMELRSLGRNTEALEAYGAVAERFTNYVPTYLMAGQVATDLNEVDVAKDWLIKGLSAAKSAGDTHAHSELSAALDALG